MHTLLLLPPAKTSHESELFLAMEDWDVTVVAGHKTPPRGQTIVLPAWRVPILGSPDHWGPALAGLRGLGKLDVGPVDVVASVELCSPTSVDAIRLARRLGVPHVVYMFDLHTRNPVYFVPPWRQISRYTAKHTDCVVCANEPARALAIKMGADPARCVVVHPGIDTSLFTPRPEGLAAERVVLFVGELRTDKGILDVLAAVRSLEGTPDECRLVIVGDGPLRGEVEQAVASSKVIEHRGRLDRGAVADVLRSARALTVPSHARALWVEQLGYSLVEAMASGLPVVSTATGNIPNVVPTGNPLVAPGDSAAIAAGLVEVLGPRGDEIGRRNREHVLESYDLRRQGQRLAAALAEVVSERATTS